jgi:hypothetical protein
MDPTIIVAICGAVVAIMQVFNTWLVNRLSNRNHAAIKEVALTVNGQMDDFKGELRKTAAVANVASFQAGQIDHLQQVKQENPDGR